MDFEIKYLLQKWSVPYKKLKSVEDTLDFYRTSYEDEIPKKELNKHLGSLESWVKFAYETKRLFEVTVLVEKTEQLYAILIFNEGNIIVQYFDEYMRKYMSYQFFGGDFGNNLFLDVLQIWEYREGSKDDENKNTLKYTGYSFVPIGNNHNMANVTLKTITLQEDGADLLEVSESTHPVNVEKNWEPYPKLGEYYSILRMKRWDNDDFLKGINLGGYGV